MKNSPERRNPCHAYIHTYIHTYLLTPSAIPTYMADIHQPEIKSKNTKVGTTYDVSMIDISNNVTLCHAFDLSFHNKAILFGFCCTDLVRWIWEELSSIGRRLSVKYEEF